MTEANELNHLIRLRGTKKSKLTILKSHIEGLGDTPLSLTNRNELARRLAANANLLTEFDELQDKIEIACDNLEDEYAERAEFENNFYAVTTRASEMLSSSTGQGDSNVVICDQNNSNSDASNRQPSSARVSSAASSNQNNNIKLPTITLPTFSGRYDGWLEYRDIFRSLIHENQGIDDMQRFHYLRASLQGEAAEVIRSLEVCERNYIGAWNLLCHRYDNSPRLIHNHIKQLFEFEPIRRESSQLLRKMVDCINKHLGALTALGQETSSWGLLIIYVISSKLDNITAREWEEFKDPDNLPSLKTFTSFLIKRADTLENIETKGTRCNENTRAANSHNPAIKPNRTHFDKFRQTRTFATNVINCSFCRGTHYTSQCNSLLQLSVTERMDAIIKRNLCINCLRFGHRANTCKSLHSCKTCHARHHTVLHLEGQSTSNQGSEEVTPASASHENVTSHTHTSTLNSINLLPTALVEVVDRFGKKHVARALLDSCSQANFITDSFARKLKLEQSIANVTVKGIGANEAQIERKCTTFIFSRQNSFSINCVCLITNYIAGSGLGGPLCANLKLPLNLKLADPNLLSTTKNEIDLLIGVEHFFSLLCVGQHVIEETNAIMQKTRFGWIVSGAVPCTDLTMACESAQVFKLATPRLHGFWDVPEPSVSKSSDHFDCEEHFLNTHYRNDEGRFIVEIPFRQSLSQLGESYNHAKQRFFALERRLAHSSEIKQKYVNFMTEYQLLGHMSPSNNRPVKSYYLPHHCVFNENSKTTKLRVVFDGSAAATCGSSINTHQHVGPKIQDELTNILLRFRTCRYVVTADISKMYRQILIKKEQRPFQRILWRNNESEDLQSYDLNTVTYGTASASYLAIRCLEQLARGVERDHPQVATHIRRSFYVDDLIAGFERKEEAVSICLKINEVLSSAGFILRKWASNSTQVVNQLSNIFIAHTINVEDCHIFDRSDQNKTLGLQWSRKEDKLSYVIPSAQFKRITKRNILSEVASVFDPLGLVGPCIVVAKILMQDLWKAKLTWDESVPMDIANRWLLFRQSLQCLNTISIPRFALVSSQFIYVHGFCDASRVAYGACIYLVSKLNSQLLCAKSRVVSLKEESTPRLELRAAVLLSELLSNVLRSVNIDFHKVVLWSDSTVVLCWLRNCSLKQPVFVKNRVNLIKSRTDVVNWRYVPTLENPADVISRGISAEKLNTLKLWWQGPQWLTNEIDWPIDISAVASPEETSEEINVLSAVIEPPADVLNIGNCSSLQKLILKTAYVLRFVNNARNNRLSNTQKFICHDERQSALKMLIGIEQKQCFKNEINLLRDGKPVRQGRLVSLNPMLSETGLLLVGGRLRNSDLPFEGKHPIILPASSNLTKLILEDAHKQLLHAGNQATISYIRQRFWPTSCRNLVRQIIRKCVVCNRNKPRFSQPPMGDLPKPRVTVSHPFLHTGVDFAGPYWMKTCVGRGTKTYKAYISLFVCLSTKALHLELVTGLDTASFLACLRRFVARRGKPSCIYSDNGSNFRSANNELQRFTNENTTKLESAAADEGIHWQFIPAYSPNFGGLWEAGVKSVKHHLKRVIGDRRLTYEQFLTLLCQIEAILNSRPISPLNSDPFDLSPLTPAHLLIGRTLLDVPDSAEHIVDVPENRLEQYQKIQALVHGFWKRWSTDYINTLQQRSKWRTPTGPLLKIGDIVILQDPNQPPRRWRMGRILTLHYGPDGTARVATVKTAQGELKRALSKLCPLVEGQDEGHV